MAFENVQAAYFETRWATVRAPPGAASRKKKDRKSPESREYVKLLKRQMSEEIQQINQTIANVSGEISSCIPDGRLDLINCITFKEAEDMLVTKRIKLLRVEWPLLKEDEKNFDKTSLYRNDITTGRYRDILLQQISKALPQTDGPVANISDSIKAAILYEYPELVECKDVAQAEALLSSEMTKYKEFEKRWD